MAAKFDQLTKFADDLKRLNEVEKEKYIEGCLKEAAARLLAKVIKDTPTRKYKDGRVGGTLKRGWTNENNQALNVKRQGDKYIIDIINPVEYASYVEYGHRTRNHKGWVDGKFMLTISANEVNEMLPQILEKRLEKMLKEVMR